MATFIVKNIQVAKYTRSTVCVDLVQRHFDLNTYPKKQEIISTCIVLDIHCNMWLILNIQFQPLRNTGTQSDCDYYHECWAGVRRWGLHITFTHLTSRRPPPLSTHSSRKSFTQKPFTCIHTYQLDTNPHTCRDTTPIDLQTKGMTEMQTKRRSKHCFPTDLFWLTK